MKGIPILIKVTRRELDNIRKHLVVLNQKKEAVETAIRNVIEEIERERELASQPTGLARFFGSFFKNMKDRRIALEMALADVNRKIAQAEEKLYETFGELKKLEIAKSNIEKREAEREKLEETKMLDEMGIQQYARAREDETST